MYIYKSKNKKIMHKISGKLVCNAFKKQRQEGGKKDAMKVKMGKYECKIFFYFSFFYSLYSLFLAINF